MYEFPRSLRIQLAKHTCMNRGRKIVQGVDNSNAWVYEFPRSRGYKLAKHTRTYRGQKTVQGLNFHDCIMCIRILCIRKLKNESYYWLRAPPIINVWITKVTRDTNWPNIHVWIKEFSARGPRKNEGLQYFSLRSGVWGSHLDSPRKSFSLWSE